LVGDGNVYNELPPEVEIEELEVIEGDQLSGDSNNSAGGDGNQLVDADAANTGAGVMTSTQTDNADSNNVSDSNNPDGSGSTQGTAAAFGAGNQQASETNDANVGSGSQVAENTGQVTQGDGNNEATGDIATFGEEGSQQIVGDIADNSNNGDRFSDDVVLDLGDNSHVGNVVLETVVTGNEITFVAEWAEEGGAEQANGNVDVSGSTNFSTMYGVNAIAMNSGSAAAQNVSVNVTASVGQSPTVAAD
jgi:hypothetical protein